VKSGAAEAGGAEDAVGFFKPAQGLKGQMRGDRGGDLGDGDRCNKGSHDSGEACPRPT